MTKAELIAKIAEDTGHKKSDVESILESLGGVAAAELLGNGEVPFPGLGKLVVVATAARPGRNPRTGVAIQIKAGKRAKFEAGKPLKDALKG
ncbi:MAG: HU family DNA-binding protein [Humidesulfovibrio sp.]